MDPLSDVLRWLAAGAMALLVVVGTWLAAPTRPTDWKALYDEHRWFDLRDGLDRTAPALYRGTVACAFNEIEECERILRSIIRSAPRSEEAADARGLLIYVYQRTGRFRRALAEIDALVAMDPKNEGLKNARGLFGALGRYPDQSVARRQRSQIESRQKGGNLFVPVTIGGHQSSYLVDTGADFSLMSESEARRLGLEIHDGALSVTDITGRSTGARTAVARELQIGATGLRHVAFLVVGDDQQPFVDLDPGERGVLGLPVLLAFETFGWTAEGTFEIAGRSRPSDRRAANLCFDGAAPVVAGRFGERQIQMQLDTGAVGTHLWPKFATDFANFLSESGVRGTRRVTGVGHSIDVPAIVVPELTLRIGGLDTVLRPAHVLVEKTSAAGERAHGNLGMDLLFQARRVTIDFRSMTLTLN